MANQTLVLNVSDEMKLDENRLDLCELQCGEELCSSSLDTTEDLYSSSATDHVESVTRLTYVGEEK